MGKEKIEPDSISKWKRKQEDKPVDVVVDVPLVVEMTEIIRQWWSKNMNDLLIEYIYTH